MKMNKIITYIVSAVIGVAAMLPCFCNRSIVYAVGMDIACPSTELSGSIKNVNTVVSQINSGIVKQMPHGFITVNGYWSLDTNGTMSATKVEGVGDENICLISLNMYDYASLDLTTKKEVMRYTLSTINSSGLNEGVKVKFYNFVYTQDEGVSSLVKNLSEDVSADFATAYGYFEPFSNTVSTVLGFLALGIVICLTFMIVLDLAYLCVPLVQTFVGIKRNENSKAKLVSPEAMRALKEAEDVNAKNYKVAVGVYLKYKALQVAMVAVCLLYLLSGKIYIAITAIIDSFSGVAGV